MRCIIFGTVLRATEPTRGSGAVGKALAVQPPNLRSADFLRNREDELSYELYDRYCVGCHGTRGKAPDPALLDILGFPSSQISPPAFDRAYFQSHTDAQLRPKITHMMKLNRIAMPHFAGKLTAEQVQEAVKYLRTLSPES